MWVLEESGLEYPLMSALLRTMDRYCLTIRGKASIYGPGLATRSLLFFASRSPRRHVRLVRIVGPGPRQPRLIALGCEVRVRVLIEAGLAGKPQCDSWRSDPGASGIQFPHYPGCGFRRGDWPGVPANGRFVCPPWVGNVRRSGKEEHLWPAFMGGYWKLVPARLGAGIAYGRANLNRRGDS